MPLPCPSYRPPAPLPQPEPLGALSLIAALKRNPLECWANAHFEKPVVTGGLPFTHVLLVNEPRAIARVLLENAANYRKDSLQRRVLSAGLGDGLLSAEGDKWRSQRRTLAPVFARKNIMAFAAEMMTAAQALVERWRARQPAMVDVSAEMARLTLEVLQRTIFSDGLGRDAEEFRIAMRTYFDTIGRIDPLDVLGVPAFVPRASQWRVRSTLRFFQSAIDDIIRRRRNCLRVFPKSTPNDILTHLLDALDPDTGDQMSEIEVRSNILTFIAAGHETTANLLTWALFLLSQSRNGASGSRPSANASLRAPSTEWLIAWSRHALSSTRPPGFIHRSPQSAASPWARTNLPANRSNADRWWSSRPTFCIVIDCSGPIRIYSIRHVSSVRSGTPSIATPTCRSGQACEPASDRLLPCRRPRSSSPPSCTISVCSSPWASASGPC